MYKHIALLNTYIASMASAIDEQYFCIISQSAKDLKIDQKKLICVSPRLQPWIRYEYQEMF